MDCSRPDEMDVPFSCCMDWEAWPECITKASGMSHVAVGLGPASFAILIRKRDEKQFTFP